MQKVSKFKQYLDYADKITKIPKKIVISSVDIEKDLYLNEDVFLPLVYLTSNYISKVILKKNIFNLKLKKTTDSLLFCVLEDNIEEDDENKDEEFLSETLKILIISSALENLFPLNLKNKAIYDNVISLLRKEFHSVNENETIVINNFIENYIKEHMNETIISLSNKVKPEL